MSRISHKHKFIFFSFPKTGSESVRSILDSYSDIKAVRHSEITEMNPFYSHITPHETKIIFEKKGWNYDEYYKFTCIRNPYHRLVSLYNMKFKIYNPILFSKWVIDLDPNSKERGNWYKNGMLSFKNFISDSDGNILVDEVIKLEEINKKLPLILKKFDIPFASVPHINKGTSVNSKIDEKCKSLIKEKYDWELSEYYAQPT